MRYSSKSNRIELAYTTCGKREVAVLTLVNYSQDYLEVQIGLGA